MIFLILFGSLVVTIFILRFLFSCFMLFMKADHLIGEPLGHLLEHLSGHLLDPVVAGVIGVLSWGCFFAVFGTTFWFLWSVL